MDDLKLRREKAKEILECRMHKMKEHQLGRVPALVSLGEIWGLGRHILHCGSSFEVKLRHTPDFVFTDPPFEMDAEKVLDILLSCGAKSWIVMMPFRQAAMLALDPRFRYRLDWIWDRRIPTSKGRAKTLHLIHAFVVYGGDSIFDRKNAGSRFSLSGANYCPSIITAPPEKLTGHKHSKNLFQTTNLVACFSGEHVFDPFGGSGTTLLACERTGKSCEMIELDPTFCDLIIRRFKMSSRNARIERL